MELIECNIDTVRSFDPLWPRSFLRPFPVGTTRAGELAR